MELQVPISECLQVPVPRLEDLDAPAADEPVAGALERLDTWYRTLQCTLDDPRPLRCERVWLHPRDHERLGAWAAEGIGSATAAARTWGWEWVLSGPSFSEDVPEGRVLIQPDAWDPPRHARGEGADDGAPSP